MNASFRIFLKCPRAVRSKYFLATIYYWRDVPRLMACLKKFLSTLRCRYIPFGQYWARVWEDQFIDFNCQNSNLSLTNLKASNFITEIPYSMIHQQSDLYFITQLINFEIKFHFYEETKTKKKKFHIQNHNKCVLQLGLLLCHCINFLSMKAETKNYFMVFPIFMLYNNEIRKIKNRWENYDSCVVVFILISFHSQHIYIYNSRDKEKSRTKCLGWYGARAYLILFKLESLSWSVFVVEWFCTLTLYNWNTNLTIMGSKLAKRNFSIVLFQIVFTKNAVQSLPLKTTVRNDI